MPQTVDIIGDGSDDNPYQPDYDGDFNNADYDFDAGTVTIDPLADE
jgi:hypothetical protein